MVKIFSASTIIHIVSGDENALTMQLVKMKEEKPDFHFNIRITFNSEVSTLHFTSPDKNSEKLDDAMTTVIQAFIAFASLMKRKRDRDGQEGVARDS